MYANSGRAKQEVYRMHEAFKKILEEANANTGAEVTASVSKIAQAFNALLQRDPELREASVEEVIEASVVFTASVMAVAASGSMSRGAFTLKDFDEMAEGIMELTALNLAKTRSVIGLMLIFGSSFRAPKR
jgi:hypothetical protein